MKKISKFLLVTIWITLVYVLFKLDLLNGDMDSLNDFFNNSAISKTLIFIALSSLRVVALIPSAVFMILGGMLFSPLKGVIMTLLSIIISQTIIYIASKILVGSQLQENIIKKYPKLYELLLKNNKKILVIGILCPLAPSDIACFLASSTDLTYRKFIFISAISNMPAMILYSFLGSNIISSTENTIIIGAFLVAISIFSLYLWNKVQRSEKRFA